MKRDAREAARLQYILESIKLIEEYTSEGIEAFLDNPMIQDAVLRRLETLADASGKLPEALKNRHAHVPWRQIHGFRNVAAHGYEAIDPMRVWEIVTEHLPPLKRALEAET